MIVLNETTMVDKKIGSTKIASRGLGRFGTLLMGIGICISIVLITTMAGDLQAMRDAWIGIHWPSLGLIGILALVNHGLRYWRWEILLKQIASSTPIKRSTAMLAFGAGSLLVFTPGRVGEVAKSIYAQRFFGIPVSMSVSILIAERLADVVVMAILAGLGLLLLDGDLSFLPLALVILTVTILIFGLWKLWLKWEILSKISHRWAGTRWNQAVDLANSSQRSVLIPRVIGMNLALGTGAWLIETAIYFLSLSALGISMDSNMFILALAVFPLASLGGSLSFLPGGLGATEGGLVALGILLGGLAEETALLASLISRASILGVVVLVGFACVPLLNMVASGSKHTKCYEKG